MSEPEPEKSYREPSSSTQLANSPPRSTPLALLYGLIAVAASLLITVFHKRHLLNVYLNDALDKLFKTRMRSLLLTALCFHAGCSVQLGSVDKYLAVQVPISKAGLLANIGPDGSRASGATVSTFLRHPIVYLSLTF